MSVEYVSDQEIDAYLDGELDLARCVAVEAYLADTPEAAARVMRDLHVRSSLRHAQQALADIPHLSEAADRLTERLSTLRRPIARFFRPGSFVAASVAISAVCGVFALSTTATIANAETPDYVSDAVEAFHTGLLRAGMTSQIESRHFDPRDIQRSTRIRVPTLPTRWRITDVQLFPSDHGPALQIMARTEAGRLVSIFAVRSNSAAPDRPVAIRQNGASTAYWRHGDMAYALTGMEAPAALDLAAQDLADNRLS